MTIVGVILSFRQLGQEALFDVLNQRIPFLLSSVIDFKEHFPFDEADPSVASVSWTRSTIELMGK